MSSKPSAKLTDLGIDQMPISPSAYKARVVGIATLAIAGLAFG